MEEKFEDKSIVSNLHVYVFHLVQLTLDVLELKVPTACQTVSASPAEQVPTVLPTVTLGVEMVVKFQDKLSVIPPLVFAQHLSNVLQILHVLVVVEPIVKLTEPVWTAL